MIQFVFCVWFSFFIQSNMYRFELIIFVHFILPIVGVLDTFY
jgi:hypothetical protein